MRGKAEGEANGCAVGFSKSQRPLPELQTRGGVTAVCLPTVNINNRSRRHTRGTDEGAEKACHWTGGGCETFSFSILVVKRRWNVGPDCLT